jgi:Zn-dependent protease with chaperone function
LILPLSLLLGFVVAAADFELLPALPGSASLASLLPVLPVLLLPALLALAALRAVRRELVHGVSPTVPPRALLRLSTAATPLAVHAVYAFGNWMDWIDALAFDSHLGRMVLATLPVFAADVPRLLPSTLAATTLEVRAELGGRLVAPALLPRRADVAEFTRMRAGGYVLVAMPLLLLGALLDVLQLDRRLYVFTLATTPGVVVGALGFLLLVLLLLPRWFAFAFRLRALPEAIATPLRATARALGFPPHRVQLLPTGLRALNAMLVGPLPFGRRLCLTDGLVRELDGEALAGVVAHEVGHARRGHPAVLIALVVVVPLALLAPLRLFELDALPTGVRGVLSVTGVAVAWLLVRALAHRFEHEADVASVQALGSGPCTRALRVVSQLALPVPHGLASRVFSLHPDEPTRWQTMQRYEAEPGFRERFDATGRRLRHAVIALLLTSLAAGAWASAQEWPFERVVYRLHSGDHAGALRAAAALGDVPQRWREPWQQVRQELAVAHELAPDATGWASAQARLGEQAWARGERVLVTAGPAAARPYFALALAAATHATALQRAMLGYCEAAADEDPARMARIAAVVRAHGVPPQVANVFAATEPRPQ